MAGFCADGLVVASKIHQRLAAPGVEVGGCWCWVKAGRLPWRLARIQMAPDRRGGTGPLHQQTIFPSSLSKAAAQTKADIKIFSINTYIYIIPLWTQNFPGCPGNTFCFDVGCGRHVEFALVRTAEWRYEPGQEPIMERAL